MKRLSHARVILFASLLAIGGRSAHADEREDFFEVKIRPVLVGTCFRCHGDTKTSGAISSFTVAWATVLFEENPLRWIS